MLRQSLPVEKKRESSNEREVRHKSHKEGKSSGDFQGSFVTVVPSRAAGGQVAGSGCSKARRLQESDRICGQTCRTMSSSQPYGRDCTSQSHRTPCRNRDSYMQGS